MSFKNITFSVASISIVLIIFSILNVEISVFGSIVNLQVKTIASLTFNESHYEPWLKNKALEEYKDKLKIFFVVLSFFMSLSLGYVFHVVCRNICNMNDHETLKEPLKKPEKSDKQEEIVELCNYI